MKLDSHQHFWNYNSLDYAWISNNMQVLKNDLLPEQLKPLLDSIHFDGSIAVQARQSLDETRWLLSLADANPFIKGVVGWVDLCSKNLDKQLAEFATNKKFVGVRHVIHDEPDDKFIARTDFRNGIRQLEKYSLTYDLLVFPKHLPLAVDLVNQFPNQPFVLDHIAKPDIVNRSKEPWASFIRQLATSPNVYCKLSGMVTEANWHDWTNSDFDYYLSTVFESFGPDRLMIGSDWPVCMVAGTYSKVMHIVIDYFNKFVSETHSKILGLNAYNFYLKKHQ